MTVQINYHTVGTVRKPNRKIVERGRETDTPRPHIYDCSLSWIGTGMHLSQKVV